VPTPLPKIDPKSADFRIEVRRSSIDRFGVFAVENIPARKRVLEFGGERITQRQAWTRMGKRFMNGDQRRTMVQLSSGWVIDPATGGSGAEFINHSCSPNLKIRKGRGKAFLWSTKPIRAGQELSWDYGFQCTCPCKCGSRACRGTMCHF
jgi:uncharacterized protein